jgi:hypothetical protein
MVMTEQENTRVKTSFFTSQNNDIKNVDGYEESIALASQKSNPSMAAIPHVPVLVQKAKFTLPQLQQWIEQTLGISIAAQSGWLQNIASASNLAGLLQAAWNALEIRSSTYF